MTHATARQTAREAKRWHPSDAPEPPARPPVVVGRLYRVTVGLFAGRFVVVEAIAPESGTVVVSLKAERGSATVGTLRLSYAPGELLAFDEWARS